MNLVYEIVLQILWTVCREVFTISQHIVWICNGVYFRIKENYKSNSYKGSVQVLNIFARHKFCVLLQPSGSDNFLLTHSEFVDPQYVLKDHVTLYYVNKHEALFVEVAEGVDVTNSKNGAFVRISQFNLAKKFIVMPLHVFNKLGESVGQPTGKLIFLCHTARCGSTLVTQVFEETGSCIAYSEPDAINAYTRLKGVVSEAERNRILGNCINLMCRPNHGKKMDLFVYKLSRPIMIEVHHIADLFPRCTIMFIYRDGLKCSKSMSKASKEVPLHALVIFLGRLSAILTKLIIKSMGFPGEAYETKLENGIHYGAMTWAVSLRQYRDLRANGMDIAGIRYEDLVEDTTHAFRKMFEFCGLLYDAKAVERAMGRDSQRGTRLSLKQLAKYKDEEFTDAIKQHTDRLCNQFGLPCFPEPYIAPGTITYRDRKTTV